MKCKLNFTKGFALFIILMLAGGNLFAQSRTVQGTVTDASGPVIGATVVVQGTSTGVTTGVDGSYSIRIPNDEAVLEFNFMGYEPVIIPVGDKTTIDVVMQEDSQLIDDVVVIGYGTVRRRDLTGSVSSVNSKTIAAAPVTNVAQALQGKLAGVNITSQDGRPDAEISIRVRGGGSVSQSNEPLVLIDGIPGSISDIPADLVASVDVLKDASSTAIYGARGANGVVLVTTKRTQEGKATVTYNGYVKFNTPTGYTDVMNPYEYLSFKWGVLDAYGYDTTPFEQLYGLGDHKGNNTGGIDSYKNVPLYDMQKKVYDSSVSHNHDLSVAGGTESTRIRFSVSYADEDGMKLMSYSRRASASFKLDQKISKNLNFNLDLRYLDRETQGHEDTTNGRGSNVSSAYRFRPISLQNMLGDKSKINHGLFTGEDTSTMLDAWDPEHVIKDRDHREMNQSIRGTAGISWNIIQGLSFRSEISLSRSYTQNKNWDGPTSNPDYLSTSGTHTDEESTIIYAGNAEYRKRDSWNLRWSNVLTYDFVIKDIHRLNVMAGYEVTDSGGTDMRIRGDRFPANFTKDNAFAMINQYGSNLRISSGDTTPNRILSFFGRANYSLLDRYLVTFTMRADGSSKFSADNRWGYFPAGALAWRLSEEEFMKPVTWIDDLKLRVSYGSVGNDNIPAGQNAQLWEAETDNRWHYSINNTPQPSYDLQSDELANPDLKWETTITRNVGLDFTLFDGKMWGSIDGYWNSTKDLLMLTEIPGFTGFTTTYKNIGETSNKGVEIALNGIIFQNKDWNITAGANISFNKGKIEELAEGVQSTYGSSFLQSGIPNSDYRLVEGKPVGIVYGYKMDGKGYYDAVNDFDYDASTGTYSLKAGVADLANDFVYTSGGKSTANAYPGAPKIKDMDGSGTINSQDMVEIGNMNPKHTGGFNINATYKNFDLGLYFNWSYGNDIYNANKLATLYNITKGGGLLGNKMDIVNDSYKYYDIQNGNLMRVTDPTALTELNRNASLPSTQLQMGYISDLGIEDGSYLRLNTLTLGYTLPKSLLSKAGISNLRIYGTIYNVFTITGYSGLDPEVSSDGHLNNARYPTPGLDWGAYPRARQFVFGLNVTF